MKGGEPVPVACTLDAAARTERVGEWHALVASSVVRVETDPTSVRLVLRDSDAALVAAASLGAREKACCAFFDVAIEIEPVTRSLRLSVPERRGGGAGAVRGAAHVLNLRS